MTGAGRGKKIEKGRIKTKDKDQQGDRMWRKRTTKEKQGAQKK